MSSQTFNAYILKDKTGIYQDPQGNSPLSYLYVFEGDVLNFYNASASVVTVTAYVTGGGYNLLGAIVPAASSSGVSGSAQAVINPTGLSNPGGSTWGASGLYNSLAYTLAFSTLAFKAPVAVYVNTIMVSQTGFTSPGATMTVFPGADIYLVSQSQSQTNVSITSNKDNNSQPLFNGQQAPTKQTSVPLSVSQGITQLTVAQIPSGSTGPFTFTLQVPSSSVSGEEAQGDTITIVIDTMGAGSGLYEE